MELRHLRYFLAIAEAASFTRRGVNPPARGNQPLSSLAPCSSIFTSSHGVDRTAQ